jgi:hypothetical protein
MKYPAFGTELYMNNKLIAQVESFNGPEISVDTDDATTHDSPAHFTEVVPTLIKSGEISLDLLYDPADTSHVAILEDMVGLALQNFEFRFPGTGRTK